MRSIDKSAFSSDVEAWLLTEGLPYCDQDDLYPSRDIKWGLAATAGAHHWIHIDCDGLGTVVYPITGKKLWIFFTPDDETSVGCFGDIDQFFNEFDVTNSPPYWMAEAVLLEPGSRL